MRPAAGKIRTPPIARCANWPPSTRGEPPYFLFSFYADIVAAADDGHSDSSAGSVLVGIDSAQLPVHRGNMDPPRHDELRAVLNHALTEHSVARLEPIFSEFTVDLLEPLAKRDSVAIVGDVAQQLPSRVIAEVLVCCSLLRVAGQHASINRIPNAAIELWRQPGQLKCLLERPELLSLGAVDELMRFVSPVQGLARITAT